MSLALAACGQQAAAPKAPAAGGTGGAAAGKTLDLGIKGEELAFDKDALTVTAAAGEEITIKFTNSSKTQQHSVVLFKHNDLDKATKFNDVAMTAVDTKYYPDGKADVTADVIAHIPALDAGQSQTVKFKSPGPGKYLYICTVPGHFAAGDKGVLTIN